MRRNRPWSAVLACLAVLASPGAAQAGETVKIGAYFFPPFVEQTPTGIGGFVADLVALMNEAQDTYTFELVDTSARGRYDDLAAGKFDMIAFENPQWGWQDRGVVASDVFTTGTEVYVARADAGRDQSYFDNVTDHKIAVVYGFHYGFADFNADPAYLQTTYMVELVLTPNSSLYYVQDGRADVAVVTRAYLRKFLADHPEFEGRFLVSDKVDQAYPLSFILRPQSAPPVDAINALLASLKQSGDLDRVLRTEED
jgi:ABC-type amino acid transport substrate-binding protein